jgi:streptogramin lyase
VLLLAALGASAANAMVLSSVFDTAGPPNVGTIIGMGVSGSDVDLFTAQTYYTSPLYNGSLNFTPTALNFPALAMRLNFQSLAAPNPSDANQAILSGGTLAATIYSFQFNPPAQSNVAIGGGAKPTGLLVDSTGAEYLTRSNDSVNGILKYASPASTTPELMFGSTGTGALTTPTALAMGPDGLIYVLDVGAGDIESFDTSGDFVNSFPLVDTPDSISLAVGSNGWLYTANGDGTGDIYDTATGDHLGTLSSTTVFNNPSDTGHTVLMAAGNYVYLQDNNDGIHVFAAPTPEPATWMMLLVGAVGFGWVRRRALTAAGAAVSDKRS